MGIKLGNGKWATKEDELLAYRVIEGKYFDRSFDFARSSTTTRVNKDGYIEDVPSDTARIDFADSVDGALLTEPASTNLITYPVSFGNPYWAKSGAGIIGDETNKTTVYSSDFSAGVDGISSTRVTSSGNNDGISDGATSYDDVLKSYASVDNATHYIYKAGMITTNVIQKISWKMYIPSANTNVNDLRITNGGSVFHYLKSSVKKVIDGTDLGAYIAAGGYITGTEGFWVEVILWVEEQSAAGTHIRWQLAKDAAETFVGAGSSADDIIYFRDFLVEDVGGFEAPKEIPTVASDLLSGWDFTSGWTAWLSATIDDNNSFTTTSNGSVYKSYLTVGTYYQIRIAGTTTTSALRLTNSVASGQYGSDINGTFDETIYFQAYINGGLGLYHAGAGTTDITTLEVKEVTSWSGGGFERDAYKLVENTEYNDHFLRRASISTTSGNVYTLSIYAKKGERTWMAIRSHTPTEYTWFDLDNGTIGTTSSEHTATITPIANGWYRCSVTYTEDNTTARAWFYAATEDNVVTYTGDGTSGIYIAYAQLEEQASATSLMLPITEGSTTSRVADACNGSGTAQDFKDYNTSGVLYAEIAANSDDGTGRWITICDGTYSNFASIYYHSTSNQVVGRLSVSGGQAEITYTLTDSTEFSKIAFRYAVNDFSLWVDGVERGTDTSGITFSANTLNEVTLSDAGGADNFYGKTRAVEVLPYMSDEEMVTLTT